jgi:anti-anti-sigma regulatory factor
MTKLSIDGELTVSGATETRTRIVEALAKGEGIELDLGTFEMIDIAGFQLLVATVKECEERDVPCVLSGPLSPPVAARAGDAGFTDAQDSTRLDLLALFRAYT